MIYGEVCNICEMEFPSSPPKPAVVEGQLRGARGAWVYACKAHKKQVIQVHDANKMGALDSRIVANILDLKIAGTDVIAIPVVLAGAGATWLTMKGMQHLVIPFFQWRPRVPVADIETIEDLGEFDEPEPEETPPPAPPPAKGREMSDYQRRRKRQQQMDAAQREKDKQRKQRRPGVYAASQPRPMHRSTLTVTGMLAEGQNGIPNRRNLPNPVSSSLRS